jgi:hypothetical protein
MCHRDTRSPRLIMSAHRLVLICVKAHALVIVYRVPVPRLEAYDHDARGCLGCTCDKETLTAPHRASMVQTFHTAGGGIKLRRDEQRPRLLCNRQSLLIPVSDEWIDLDNVTFTGIMNGCGKAVKSEFTALGSLLTIPSTSLKHPLSVLLNLTCYEQLISAPRSGRRSLERVYKLERGFFGTCFLSSSFLYLVSLSIHPQTLRTSC